MAFAIRTVTAILIQTTCVARMLCRLPFLSHVEAQPLLTDDFNLEDAVDATQTGSPNEAFASVGETFEDFGGQESLDDWLTRRLCEGRLSALQSARGAASAVRSR